MDEVLSIRPITSSVEQFGLLMQDPFLPIESDKRNSLESIQDSLSFSGKMKVFLRMRSLAPMLNSNFEDQDEIFVVLNSTNLLTKIPISESTNSRRSKQPNSVETQNIRKYRFTSIFTPEISQDHFFEITAKQNILDLIVGQSSTLMGYGTTNSGKTYTVFGSNNSPGIIPRSIILLFSKIDCTLTPYYKPSYGNNIICLNEQDRILEIDVREKLLSCRSIDKSESLETFLKLQENFFKDDQESFDGFTYSVWLSFIEIYNETIFDLLSVNDEGKNMQLKLVTDKKGNTCLKGLRMVSVTTALEAFQIMMAGKSRLSIASTAMNSKSSRSHTIFTMTLLKYSKEYAPEEVIVSKVTFCDLAGSGGQRKASDPQRIKESRSINASLLVLGRCLKSVREGQLSRQSMDITGPFRESNITRFFQKALSGKENITLLVNINPSPELYVETQSVLNFSSIAKKVILESSKDSRRSIDSQLTVQTSIPEFPVKIDYQKNFDELQEQNQALLQEISTLKTSALDKEYEIRQELSKFYSSMMKDLEENWKKKNEEIEEEQEDLLKWSVNQVEVYYKERIDNITNRKRRRLSSSGDHGDFDGTTLETLEAENAEATTKIISLRQIIENLKKKNQDLSAQKSEFLFQLAVTKKELKELKELRKLNGLIDSEEEENSINKRRESFLFEFNEYWAKTTDLEDQLKEKTDLIQSLEDQLREKDLQIFEMRDKWQKAEARVEELEVKISYKSLERLADDRIIASSNLKIPSHVLSPDSLYKISMIEAESSLIEDYGTPDISLKTLVRVPTLVPFDLPEDTRLSFLDSSGEKSDNSDPRSSCKDDSGIMTSSGSQRTSDLNKIETDDKYTQANINQEDDLEKIRERHEFLKLEYEKLKNNYSSESLKVKELETELMNIRESILSLDENSKSQETIIEYERKLDLKEKDLKRLSDDKNQIQIKYNDIFKNFELKSKEYKNKLDELNSSLKTKEENETRTSKCLDEYIEKSASLESQLAIVQAQLDKTTIKCLTEYVPKIDKLEKELFEKTLRVSELNGKMTEVERDLVRLADLNEKVNEFEEILDKCQREKDDLRRQLHERSENQSSLESKLKKLITKIQDRESEVLSLQTSLDQTKSANFVNSVKTNELNQQISESWIKMGDIKSELLRSEEARKNVERILKEEVSFLRSRLSASKKHENLLRMMCEKNENCEVEMNKLKLELCEKEGEMNILKKNRDTAIQKYDSLVRQLQMETKIEKNKRSKKSFPHLVTSKELTKSISESFKTKKGKFYSQRKSSSHTLSEGSMNFWKTFNEKPVLDERIFPLPASSKISSSQPAISTSLELIPKTVGKSNRSEKTGGKKESYQVESDSMLEIVLQSELEDYYHNLNS